MAIIETPPKSLVTQRFNFATLKNFLSNISFRIIKRGIQSVNFVPNSRGWRIDGEGNIEAGSILFNRQFVMTFFESLDGWTTLVTGSGLNTLDLGSLYLKTGATINSTAGVVNDNLSILPLDFQNKDSLFETLLQIPTQTGPAYTAYFALGNIQAGDSTVQGYGFKVVNDTLSALVVISGVESLTTITGITVSSSNVYLAINKAAEKKVQFYVNGVLRTTINTTYGAGASAIEDRFYFYLKITVGSSNKEMYINHAIFAQDS